MLAINFLINFGFPFRFVVMKSVSSSILRRSFYRSAILINPVASGSNYCQAFLNLAMLALNTSKPASSLELVNPFKMTATKRFRKMVLTIS